MCKHLVAVCLNKKLKFDGVLVAKAVYKSKNKVGRPKNQISTALNYE